LDNHEYSFNRSEFLHLVKCKRGIKLVKETKIEL